MTQPTVTLLKELLFDEENRTLNTLDERLRAADERALKSEQTIDALAHEVSRIDGRQREGDRELDTRLKDLAQQVGSEPIFEARVGNVLHRSIASAEKVRHRELADAMAPMVQRVFRAELRAKTIQDELTTAIYPKLGEMVRRYVSSAMRDMMETINRRLDSGLKQNAVVLKLRSLATGRSMAELALSDTQSFKVDELYLIREGSGELIHHWTPDMPPGSDRGDIGGNRDTLVSGFLTAITAFAKEAFASDQSALRALDLDQHRIYLRASPGHLLAAKCSGRPQAGVENILDQSMLDLLSAHQRIEAQHPGDQGAQARDAAKRELGLLLDDFADRLEGDIRAAEAAARPQKGGFRPLKIALWLIGLALAGFIGWNEYQSFVTNRVQAAVDGVIAGDPMLRGYPVHATARRGGDRVRVSGLTPTESARANLLAALGAAVPHATLDNSVAVLPAADVAGALATAEATQAGARVRERLRLLDGNLAAIGSAMPSGDKRDLVDRARAGVAKAAGDIAGGSAQPASREIGARLAATSQALNAVAAHLSRALAATGRPQNGLVATPKARSPLATSEEIAATAERIHVLATSIAANEVAERQRSKLLATLEAQSQQRMERLTRDNAALARSVADLSQKLAAIRIPQPSPRQLLEAFMRDHAIFFSDGVTYRDAAAASATLDALAALLKGRPDRVRVAGYTDEIGGKVNQRNTLLSMQRADKVVAALIERGVSRQQLVAVGRANTSDLAPVSGSSTPNRRVQFELGFIGEGGIAP
ncbi:MAG: OmpA family protein [Hyphomicrobiaceae bacterium]